ncbi:MAG: LysR family transcriptional regulator, partial [Roseiarcus sp.]
MLTKHDERRPAAVELRDLHWAITASNFRSLRQAASLLNVRQSTLSRSLRKLEDQLGATLFERTNGGTSGSNLTFESWLGFPMRARRASLRDARRKIPLRFVRRYSPAQ